MLRIEESLQQVTGKTEGIFQIRRMKGHAVDICCPHFGCQVEWNPDERRWDCPCHGSKA